MKTAASVRKQKIKKLYMDFEKSTNSIEKDKKISYLIIYCTISFCYQSVLITLRNYYSGKSMFLMLLI